MINLGAIGFSGGDSFIQRAIRFFTGSDFSHTFLVMAGPDAEPAALGTTATIVHFVPLEKEVDSSQWLWVVEPIASDKAKTDAATIIYRHFSGESYGYLSYLWFLYRWAMRQFGYEPMLMWDWAEPGITCTELTARYLSLLGPEFFDLFEGRDYSAIAPEDLRQIVIRNPHLFRVVGWVILKP
jgi:hypothetical protein